MRVLITGVTGNVGRACKELFDDFEDWEVIGVSRQKGLDLKDMPKVRMFVNEQAPFDLVIMAHGTQHGIKLSEKDFISWFDSVIDDNLFTSAELTHYLISYNKLSNNALIVYCSSIQATQPRAGRGPYAIAKAGLEALAKTVAVEQAGRGIRAVALRLGQLDSQMAGVTFEPEQLKEITSRLPLPLVPCAEVAKLCLDLYQLKSLTGSVIDFDSGHHLNVWPSSK